MAGGMASPDVPYGDARKGRCPFKVHRNPVEPSVGSLRHCCWACMRLASANGADDGIRTRDPHLGNVENSVHRVRSSLWNWAESFSVSSWSTRCWAVVERSTESCDHIVSSRSPLPTLRSGPLQRHLRLVPLRIAIRTCRPIDWCASVPRLSPEHAVWAHLGGADTYDRTDNGSNRDQSPDATPSRKGRNDHAGDGEDKPRLTISPLTRLLAGVDGFRLPRHKSKCLNVTWSFVVPFDQPILEEVRCYAVRKVASIMHASRILIPSLSRAAWL